MKKVKGIVFDVDGTLIEQNSWEKLNLALGIPPKVDQRMFNDYYAGKFTYQEWVDQVVSLYQANGPVSRQRIDAILNRYVLSRGARETSLALQERNYLVGIVSGGLNTVVDSVAKDVGVRPEFTYANSTVVCDEAGNLVRITTTGEDHDVKLGHLHDLCNRWGIALDECVCVGDSYPDLPLFEAIGRGVTFNYPRCHMLQESPCCWKQISALPELLHFL